MSEQVIDVTEKTIEKFRADEMWMAEYRPGMCRFGPKSGAVWIFDADIVTPFGLVADQESIRDIRGVEDSPVYYNEKQIGKIKNVGYSDKFKHSVLFFHYDPDAEIDLIRGKESQLIGVPDLLIESIGCPQCGGFYQIADTPCDCIHTASSLIIKKIFVQGLTFWNGMQENILEKVDLKSDLLWRFFAGALGNLHFIEEL